MAVTVADWEVYVNTQGTQTVKICTPSNTRGEYEKYYRIRSPFVLEQRQMEVRVSQFPNLVELERWLVTDRRAERERQNEVASASPVLPPPPPPPPLPVDTAVEISIEIRRDNVLVGILRTTRKGVTWLPRGQPAGHRLSWAKLEELAALHGEAVGVH